MKQTIILLAFCGFLALILSSYSTGPAANGAGNLTGAVGNAGGCYCHNSTSSIGTTVELDSAGVLVTTYHPGVSYTVKIKATNNTGATLSHFGFQVSTVKSANAGTSSAAQAGTWGTPPTNTHNTTTGSCSVIEHSTPLTPTSGSGGTGTVYSESIPWTAPVSGTGSVKIYGALNAVNFDGSDGGDNFQLASAVTITEAVTPVASVSIALTTGTNPACAGSGLVFTATPTNGGSAPSYQWKVGTTSVGTNSDTFSTNSLTTGQAVTCVMTSNLGGVTGSPATSSAITMTINPILTPSVTIATRSPTICAGSIDTFTATPTNGGTPSYQWKVGTTNEGTNSATFITSTLTNGQVVSCVMTSTAACASLATATSNPITVTVNPTVTPSVSISASNTTICASSADTFTATPTNGGTPSYQWKIGTTNAGTNSPTFITSALTNGQAVSCVMTSTATCASPASVTSNPITVIVIPTVTPTISIHSLATAICAGAADTLAAATTNGGTAPSYQWKVGTTNTGPNSDTFITSAVTNGQVVTCFLTSNATCATTDTATSNRLTTTVNPIVTPSVIIATRSQTICAAAPDTFTASPTNGGTASYQWKVGATNAGTNSPTFITSALTNGQTVSCVMTSTAACASPATATSSPITVTVNPTVTPSITISPSGTTICAGTPDTFTATPTNGGTPSYQWKVGTTNEGTNSPTFITSALTNGQTVSCVMISTATCASPASVTSNPTTVTVNPALRPSIGISTSITGICPGSPVTFAAIDTNGGPIPIYQWKVGATNAGTDSSGFTTAALTNGQVVTCLLTSNATCASPDTARSNAITMSVSANQVPSITISQRSISPVCSGSADTLAAQATNGGATPAYQWRVNGANAGTNSSTFISSSLTSGSVVGCRLISSLSCAVPDSALSNTLTATITALVTPTLTISARYDTICPGAVDSFAASGSGLGATPAYQWLVNSAHTGTNSASYTTSSLTNNNTIRCVVTSNAVCASPAQDTSNTISITIHPDPSVSITPSGAVTVCAGDSLLLAASGGTSYLWTNSDTGSSIWAHQSGTYDVSGSNGSCAATALTAATVTIDSPATPTITQGGNVLTSSSSEGYQWILNGTALTGDTARTYTITQSGNYEVSTHDVNGCYAQSVTSFYTYVNGITSVASDLHVKLYPVPNHGSFVVEADGLTDADLVIYDIYGQRLYQQKLSSGRSQINGIDLAAAVYFVTVSDGGRTETIKMEVK